jgi:NDP-sugar pyrophosphorylase family protein
MIYPVAILAGGLATRLYPVTKTIPKSMIELAGKTFISHQIELLKKKGITRVVICTGYLGEQIKDFLKDGTEHGISVDYSFDGDKLLGTGGALKKALPLLGNIFFVMYGDSYLNTDFKSILDYFLSHDKMGLMTVYKNENLWDKSNIIYSEGKILKYDKKDISPEMKYIDYGLGLLRKEAFQNITENEVLDLADLYKELINREGMLGYEVKERFYEIGSSEGLEETEKYLKKTKIER